LRCCRNTGVRYHYISHSFCEHISTLEREMTAVITVLLLYLQEEKEQLEEPSAERNQDHHEKKRNKAGT
jgi:hypothetical protein